MDINFHYFAVKTIARFVGFEEEDAQCIAEYSQFVDDYNLIGACVVQNIDGQWLRSHDASSIVRQVNWKGENAYILRPYTTGFTTEGLTGYRDMAFTTRLSFQLSVVSPFHFIPLIKIRENSLNSTPRELFRTVPIDYNGNEKDTILIFNLLNKARTQYQTYQDRESLIRIGALLHVYADTFAHEGFSGMRGYENYAYVTDCRNALDDSIDYTKSQQYLYTMYVVPYPYSLLPAIGHAELAHAPDMSYAKYSWKKAASSSEDGTSKYTSVSTRDNTLMFLRASESIYKYLYQCLNGTPLTGDVRMPDPLSTILAKGFSTFYNADKPDVDDLCVKWTQAITGNDGKKIIDTKYEYSKSALFDNQMEYNRNDPYFLNLENICFGDSCGQTPPISGIYYTTIHNDLLYFNLVAKDVVNTVVEFATSTEVESNNYFNEIVNCLK